MRIATVTRFAALAVALSLTVAAASGAAHAQTGGGELGSDYVRATASDLGGGTFPGPGVPAREPSTASLFDWTRETGPLVCVFFTAPVPPGRTVADWGPAPNVAFGLDGSLAPLSLVQPQRDAEGKWRGLLYWRPNAPTWHTGFSSLRADRQNLRAGRGARTLDGRC